MLSLNQDLINKNSSILFKDLGVVDYKKSLADMRLLIDSSSFKEEIWFLEHPPVYTLGTAASKEHILKKTNIPIIQSNRGGEVTFHGPGQVIIYFMLDIKKRNLGPKQFIFFLQEMTCSLLKELKIDSYFIKDAPGVYVEEKKIASIGLRFSKGKSYHGLSINFDMDLSPFNYINPCGYKNLEVVNVVHYNKECSKIKFKNLMKEHIMNYTH